METGLAVNCRGVKSAQYSTVEYEIDLDNKDSYMCKFRDGRKGLRGEESGKIMK